MTVQFHNHIPTAALFNARLQYSFQSIRCPESMHEYSVTATQFTRHYLAVLTALIGNVESADAQPLTIDGLILAANQTILASS